MLVRTLLSLLALASTAAAQLTLSAADLSALRQDMAVSDLSLQRLALPAQSDGAFAVQVELDGAPVQLLMSPYSMRSDEFQLLVETAPGVITAQTPEAPATYRGTVEGIPGSIVAGSLVDGQLTALVRIARGLPVFGVQPASATVRSAARDLHVVFSSSDAVPLDGTCGTDTSGPWTPEAPLSPVGPGDGPGDAGEKVCEIACDADVEFYTKNGSSVANTQADIENVLNAVEAIYQAEVGILYTTTTILVRTVETDPFSSTDASTLLGQFSGHWNSSQGTIPRDVAHLFTGKSINGGTIGIAYLNVLCNKSSAYGLSESKWTGSMLWRAGLTAHELGHNWSAQHCDGAGDCFIMCSGIGGCAGDINNFGAGEKQQINNKKNSVNCLSDPGPTPPPTAASLSPTSVPAFMPGTVTITGTNLSTTLKVTVGGIEVTASTGLVSVGNTQVSFFPPIPTSLGNKSVTVTTTGGTTGALTLGYTETSPPVLSAEFLVFTGTPFTWSWGAGANDPFQLVVSASSASFPFQGHDILANTLIVLTGTTNGAGVGSLTVNIPASVAGLTFWSQLLTFGPVQPSPIISSWVLQ